MRIHVWLEEREIAGLEPAFRATLTLTDKSASTTPSSGCGSLGELHVALDRALQEAGVVDGGTG